MNTTSKKNLDALLGKAKKSTTWKEKAKAEIQNEGWLKRSFFIALAVNTELKDKGYTQTWLADQLDCSRQYMHKLLKGKENLTLETIFKLESALNIELIRVPKDFKENSSEEVLSRSKTNSINQSTVKEQFVTNVKYASALKLSVVYSTINNNKAA
jgi:transcriptional regulator with XRE-family HTH domain